MQMKSIEIDFDIHKLIEAERRGFDEPEYVALRRLLGLKEAAGPVETDAASEGRPFIQDGVSIPHGSLARMEYLRGSQVYEGQFLDGCLVLEGTKSSLSSAAAAVAVTKDGTKPSLNGWLYWQAQVPGQQEWRSLDDLRAEFRKRGGK
ncbi:hypothetical protein [Pseudophaeobacter leonis]|uniref:hypothetical protein n=1 Tax=Pseudophaeobacter leonis TaxID=1144477 RepID=UPI0009F20FA6|nr:hypothetical protein [Pseudophaeobacter leonis]